MGAPVGDNLLGHPTMATSTGTLRACPGGIWPHDMGHLLLLLWKPERAIRWVALFAAVLPDSAAALVAELDEPEAFLREPSSFVLGAYVDDAPVGLACGVADALTEWTAHHLAPRAGRA